MPSYKGHGVTHQRLTQARSRTPIRAPWARGGRAMRDTQAGSVSAREWLARRDSPREGGCDLGGTASLTAVVVWSRSCTPHAPGGGQESHEDRSSVE